MHLPDDFGLSPVATLAHVGAPARPPVFPAFWKNWSAAAWSIEARLEPRAPRDTDASDGSATHQFTSFGSTRIGAILLAPKRPRGAVVTAHGYENVPTLAGQSRRWRPLVDRGLAVLLVRVRGYPGSQAECGDWTATPTGYITRGLEVPVSDRGLGCEWSFSFACADLLLACRALRGSLGPGVPISLHGESFGAALAVVAAAQLAERDPPSRLSIALPTMGDWPWRLAQPRRGGVGAGAHVRRFLQDHPELEESAGTLLRLFDTVLHARRVVCPVLCKLALRDDVVPAPTAAAAFNALATDPGRKWRYVTRCGHFDAGLADLRRHAEFERWVHDFLDPARDPADSLRDRG